MPKPRAVPSSLRRTLGEPAAAGPGAALSIGLCAAIVVGKRAGAARPDDPARLRARRHRGARGIAFGPARSRAPHAGDRAARLGRAADQPARSAMSSSFTPLATATGRGHGVGDAAPRCRPWSWPIWRWCARRAPPGRPMRNGTAGTAISRGRIGARQARRCSNRIEARLAGWASEAAGEPERQLREERLGLAFGRHGASWNEELVLERYELLYEAGLVAEAARDPRPANAEGQRRRASLTGVAMALGPSPHPGDRDRRGCAARSNTARSCSS